MAVTVKRELENQIAVYVTAGALGQRPAISLRLDMSLQRHCYRNVADAQAKDQNSIMCDMISDAEIMADAKLVGERLEDALRHVAPERIAEGRDYKLVTKRVYRVDSTVPRPTVPNHFFPVSGPGVWSAIDRPTFAAISHFRNLEVLLLEKFPGTLATEDLYRIYLELKEAKKRIAVRAEGLNMTNNLRVEANKRIKALIDCMDTVTLNAAFNQLSDSVKSRIVDCAGNKPWHLNILRFLSDFARHKARSV